MCQIWFNGSMHCNSDISKLRKFCILETLVYFLVTIDSVLHFCVTFHNSTQSRVRAGSSVAVAPRLEMKTNFSAGLPVQQSRTAVNSVNSSWFLRKMWNFVWSWEIGENDSKFIWCCQCQQPKQQPIWEANRIKATSSGNWFSFTKEWTSHVNKLFFSLKCLFCL